MSTMLPEVMPEGRRMDGNSICAVLAQQWEAGEGTDEALVLGQ